MMGLVPIIKGSFPLFHGGEKMLNILDDRQPGRSTVKFLIFTIIFQIFIRGMKKYKTYHLQEVSTFAQNLRPTLVNNFLNIYGLVLLLVGNVLTLLSLWRQATKMLEQFKLFWKYFNWSELVMAFFSVLSSSVLLSLISFFFLLIRY